MVDNIPITFGELATAEEPDSNFSEDLGEDCTNSVPVLPFDNWILGVMTASTKHPELAVHQRRKLTFLLWPSTAARPAEELINMNFFYTGAFSLYTIVIVCCYYSMNRPWRHSWMFFMWNRDF